MFTGKRCTHESRVSSTKAEANAARVAPFFRPTIRPASPDVSAMNQFSVFGSPPMAGAMSAGGCTCRLSRSRQSSHLIKIGNGRSAGHSGPMISGPRWVSTSRIFMPSRVPPTQIDCASGRSTTSQLSPIGPSRGKFRCNEDSSTRPPHTRSW